MHHVALGLGHYAQKPASLWVAQDAGVAPTPTSSDARYPSGSGRVVRSDADRGSTQGADLERRRWRRMLGSLLPWLSTLPAHRPAAACGFGAPSLLTQLMGVSHDHASASRLGLLRGALCRGDVGIHPGDQGIVRATPSTSMARG